MILLIKYKKNSIDYSNCDSSFAVEVKTFNIITSKMDDSFIPYRVNRNCMMWVSDGGVLGEIECIFPDVIGNFPEYIEKDMPKFKGFPLVESVYSDSSSKVYIEEDRFILVFDDSELATIRYQQDNVYLHASDHSILAFECKMFQRG